MQTLSLAVWLAMVSAAQSGVVIRMDWSQIAERNADLIAVRGEYIAAVNEGDGERAAKLYASDALAVLGETQVLRGSSAVGDRLRDGLLTANGTVTLQPRRFSVSGQVGSETGTYTITDPTAGVAPTEGIYVTVYSQGRDGRWRIAMEVRTGNGTW